MGTAAAPPKRYVWDEFDDGEEANYQPPARRRSRAAASRRLHLDASDVLCMQLPVPPKLGLGKEAACLRLDGDGARALHGELPHGGRAAHVRLDRDDRSHGRGEGGASGRRAPSRLHARGGCRVESKRTPNGLAADHRLKTARAALAMRVCPGAL